MEKAREKFSIPKTSSTLMMFLAATGITDGELIKGIRYTSFGAISQSIVMRGESKTVQ